MRVLRKRAGLLIIAAVVFVPAALPAQSPNGMSLNGSTGLYTVPTGRIGWSNTNLGMDFGYRTIISDSFNGGTEEGHGDTYRLNHMGLFNISLFKWVELGLTFDYQPPYDIPESGNESNSDLLFHFKVQFPTKATAIAVGGDFQAVNVANEDLYYSAARIYAAATYSGTFFTMPADTTVTLGKTFAFGDHAAHYNGADWDFDFGMGFDLCLFPNSLKNLLHWVIDYSNFSYSADPWGVEPWRRGTLNTGFRFDLAAIPALSKYKLNIDILATDLFDEYSRSFSFGLNFGLPIL
jgi:hypothetical protein